MAAPPGTENPFQKPETASKLQAFSAAIVEFSDDAIISKTLNGTITFWNPSAEKMFGYSSKEAVGEPVGLIIPPEKMEEENRILDRIRRGERIRHYETVRLAKDGGRIDVSLTVSPIQDASGKIVGASKIARDITDRKRIEAELERLRIRAGADFRGMKHLHRISNRLVNKENMTSLFEEIIRAAVAVTEADKGAIQIADPETGSLEIAAQIGFAPSFADRIGSVPGGRLASGEAMRSEKRVIVEDIAQSPLYENTLVREILLSDGIQSLQSTPLRSRSGKILGALSTHHADLGRPSEDKLQLLDLIARQAADFIDRLQAERSLAESRLRFETIFNSLGDAVVFADKDRRIVLVNPAFTQTFGYEPEEVLGRNTRFLYDDPEDYHRQGRERYHLGLASEHVPFQIRYRRKDGAVFWCETHGGRVRNPNGEPIGFLAIHRDITARKRDEDALRQNRKALEDLNETLEKRVAERTEESRRLTDQLRALAAELTRVEQRERKRLAEILHENLQQLLTAAQLKADWVLEHPRHEKSEASLSEIVSILKEAVDTSRSLTAELSPPVLADAGLAGGLSWLADHMEEKHGLRVSLKVDEAAEPPAEEIRLMLFQAVRELLLNVVRYAEVDEARLVLERTQDGITKLSVKDHGKGFDPDILRASGPKEPETYGLFSIQQRLAHLGGRMELETKAGRGVTVTLYAPSAKSAPETAPKPFAPSADPPPETEPEQDRSGVIRVLLVDDHKILREGLAGLLGAEPDIDIVAEAEDGNQAVELAEKHRPDVVVMDVKLPGISGIEATRILSRTLPRTKVIGLSMHVDPQISKAMRDAGATAYHSKGDAAGVLLEAIRSSVNEEETGDSAGPAGSPSPSETET